MTPERWDELMDADYPQLTEAEMAKGWHWCGDWDDMPVGPGMEEYELCNCGAKEETHDQDS